jgi:glycosyltransferase involved in cell wall biosynthesis
MKVSVVIPTYNRENYICSAINSVLQQSMADIEIIVVDDGSTDNTKKKIEKYFDKIKYIYTQNGGPAHARNIGMEQAQGDYIAWLDSDDLYYPFKIELQTKILDEFQDIGLVYRDFSAFSEEGLLGEYYLKKYHSSAYGKGLSYGDIFEQEMASQNIDVFRHFPQQFTIYTGNIFEIYFQNIIVFTNSIMFRRNFLDTLGLQEKKYGLFHDLEFVLRICKHCRVAFTDIPTYKLRYHECQISEPTKDRHVQLIIEKQQALLKIGQDYGIKDRHFYQLQPELVNARLAVLHKALAIPLLTGGKQPELARFHLDKCKDYGYPEPMLRFLSFVPYILRRIAFKGLSLLKLA